MDYITIIQGDDTNFLGDQFLVVNFETEIDLSGFTANFILGDVTMTYGDLSGKTFEIVLSNEITSNLKIGKQYGELKLIDTNNRIRTITSIIPFIVKKGVNEDISFVNSSLSVSMNVNDTTINIFVETSGISRTEASRVLQACNDAKQATQNYSNTAQNTLIQMNSDIAEFYKNTSDISLLVDKAEESAKQAIEKSQEVNDVLSSSAKNDFSNLSAVALDKINQSKALKTGLISTDNDIYTALLSEFQNSTLSGADVIAENYTLSSNLTLSNGITEGLTNTTDFVSVPINISGYEQIPFKIHLEAIIKSLGNSYLCYSKQMAIGIQIQYNGALSVYIYANDGNTKMLQTAGIALQENDRYVVDVGYDEINGLYGQVSCQDKVEKATENIGSAWLRNTVEELYIGKNSWSGSCSVEVDLAHSYIELNGKKTRLLAQIPYKLSTTGAKIADVESRELVQELFENKGVASYFTIDTENQNFTLPMGDIYGMFEKKSNVDLSNSKPCDNFIAEILENFAPDTAQILKISTTPTSASSAYTTPCAGWYVCSADSSTKRYLYINGVQTGYCLSSSAQSISVFLGKSTSIYWSGSFSSVSSQTFIPAKGAKYVKSASDDLDDILG